MRDKTLFFYLGARQRDQVVARTANILTRVVEVVEASGWTVVLLPEEARHAAASMNGYHLVLNQVVPGPHALSLRKCYMEPFWRLETVNDRWAWEVARLPFDPEMGKVGHLRWFYNHWQGKLFDKNAIARDGFIFVPLQGKLTRHRSFQSMSPVQMILETLAADPDRPVRATLHPGEVYAPEEIEALTLLAAQEPRFTLSDRPSIRLLARCDMVVTQNSSMALTGFFAEKPAVLFAQADFHHIAGSVPRDGVERAFAKARGPAPAYAEYLFWFFKRNAITSWDDNVRNRIHDRLLQHGWPV